MLKRVNGFTLIELMIVASIVAILSMIVIPKFANVVLRSREAALKGKLGSVRSAISIYYANTEGRFPGKGYPDATTLNIMGGHFILLETSLVPVYISEIPNMTVPSPPHTGNNTPSAIYSESTFLNDIYCCANVATALGYLGSRSYNIVYSSSTGRIFVNCYHADSSGQTWSQY